MKAKLVTLTKKRRGRIIAIAKDGTVFYLGWRKASNEPVLTLVADEGLAERLKAVGLEQATLAAPL